MIGISWRSANEMPLSIFTLPQETIEPRLIQFAKDNTLTELIYLSTCNRVELLFLHTGAVNDLRPSAFKMLTGREGTPNELRLLKAWGGEGAVEHLFLVMSGLDSAMVGETEIAGQVRDAWQYSKEIGLCGPVLNTLLEEANRVSAKVRHQTQISIGRVSLAQIAVDVLTERYNKTPGTIALLGVSPMTEKTAASLHSKEIPFIVINRTLNKAKILAKQYNTSAVSLETFTQTPIPIEALLSATGASIPIMNEKQLKNLSICSSSKQPPLIIDMSVPSNFDSEVCKKYDMPYINMQHITQLAEQNRDARLLRTASARELVDQALIETVERFAERKSGQLFTVLQAQYHKTAEEGIKRLIKKDLSNLTEKDQEKLHNWASTLAKRLAHIPCTGLRGLLHNGPEGSIDAFINALDSKFADEMRSALQDNLSNKNK